MHRHKGKVLNFEDEPYVRVYSRKTLTFKRLGWEGRTVLWHLMLEADRSGVIDVGLGDAIEAVADIIELPVEVVRVGLERLASHGVTERHEASLVITNFIEAQEAKRPDRVRAKEYRQRHRAEKRKTTPPNNPDEYAETVTPRHAPSQTVTDRHSPIAPIAPIAPLAGEAEPPTTATEFTMHVGWSPTQQTVAGMVIAGVADWAIVELVGRYRVHFVADPGELRSEAEWNQSCAKWVLGDWRDPKKRPIKPQSTPADADSRRASAAAAEARAEAQRLARSGALPQAVQRDLASGVFPTASGLATGHPDATAGHS